MRRLLALVLVVALGVGGTAVFVVRRPFPSTSGEVGLPVLSAPVEVHRDAWGVPHIYASSVYDLFVAQGFVHAQDRFWQMDFWRHVGAGRTAELFGPSQVETDAFIRTLGWERIAEEEWERFDPDSRRLLSAYTEGVNSWLEGRPGTALSLEHTILRLTNRGYRPAPWTAVNSLTWGKAMAWDLKSNYEEELARGLLTASLPRERIEQLYPPYPDEAPTIVADGSAVALPAGALPALRRAGRGSALLDGLVGPLGRGVGSNNWVIAGDRTESGLPILADDPHLPIQMPSIWYEIGLHCRPRTDACPYDVVGFSFAGVPGVIIGHNHRIAWGVTNLGADVMDLYVERTHPDDPDRYEVNGEWVEMEVRTEVVEVAGGEPVEVRARATRHGPVISDVHEDLGELDRRSGLEVPEDFAVALRWTALEPSSIFRSIWRINRAESWEEFREALRDFDVPSQNFVYADVDGNIGYQAPGRIPIRAEGDGRYPVPGWTDRHEWTGWVPFEQLPNSFNPPAGYLATANNRPVSPGSSLLGADWSYGYRARRIVEMLEAHEGPIGVDDVLAMQLDTADLHAPALVTALSRLDPADRGARAAVDVLRSWDGRHGVDSAGAALFQAVWRHLLAETFWDELPEDHRPEGFDRWFEVVRHLLERPDDPWWDDTETPGREGRDAILERALSGAVMELRGRLGDDPAGWRWGALHTATFRNQSLGKSGIAPIERLFNRGPYEAPGSSSVVNNIGWDADEGYEVTWIPSMRMVVDLSDLAGSWTIHSTGQSGHAFHPHYQDLIGPWLSGEVHPMLWEREDVEEASVAVLRLVP